MADFILRDNEETGVGMLYLKAMGKFWLTSEFRIKDNEMKTCIMRSVGLSRA